jgi:acetyl-CoA C-acetyltransferase
MKASRGHHDHNISQKTLAKAAGKNPRNGMLNLNALRRKLIPEEEILNSKVVNYPLAQYMFCAPDEGRGGGDHVQRHQHLVGPLLCSRLTPIR